MNVSTSKSSCTYGQAFENIRLRLQSYLLACANYQEIFREGVTEPAIISRPKNRPGTHARAARPDSTPSRINLGANYSYTKNKCWQRKLRYVLASSYCGNSLVHRSIVRTYGNKQFQQAASFRPHNPLHVIECYSGSI